MSKPAEIMKPDRLSAFTDGVIAIIITIMVLELPVPNGDRWADVQSSLPLFGAYALSFANVGIFWVNHHHMFHLAKRVDGRVLLANLFMLFWLSLVPFVIRWIGEADISAMPGSIPRSSAPLPCCPGRTTSTRSPRGGHAMRSATGRARPRPSRSASPGPTRRRCC